MKRKDARRLLAALSLPTTGPVTWADLVAALLAASEVKA